MEVCPELVGYPIAKIYAIAMLLGFLLFYNKKQKIFLNFKQDYFMLGLLFAIVISFFVGWIPRCLEVLDQMLKNVIVYTLIVGIISTEKKLKIFLWALVIINAILAFDAAINFINMDIDTANLNVGRLGGFSGAWFGDSGDFALAMNSIIPYAVFLGIAGRPVLLRPLALFISALFVVAIIATRARGGFIAFGFIMLLISYFGIKLPKIWQKLICISLVICAIGGIIAFSPAIFKERAQTILDYKAQDTAVRRIEYWKVGIKMFLSNPLVGVGAGNYRFRYRDFGGWENEWPVPHNMYIEVLSELGILGFSCLFLLLFFTLADSFKAAKLLRKNKDNVFLYSMNEAAMISLLGYCIGGMFLAIFTYPILYILIAINVAVANVTKKTNDKNESIVNYKPITLSA
jgi:probable O-glycosylation ligase (exosortase A-associated)